MFNLLIAYTEDEWVGDEWRIERSRVAIEYTTNDISERYRELDETAISELKSFPCLFAVEHEAVATKIGYITNILVEGGDVSVGFEFDQNLPELPQGALENMRQEIELGKLELYRTHWAVKDQPLWDILLSKEYITSAQLEAAISARQPFAIVPAEEAATTVSTGAADDVFIVHGQDELAKLEMAEFVRSLGLNPIILHQQANLGMTIIEKIEHYANVGFGIVLYTECDEGRRRGELSARYRARQNVVFEHGYLIARLGRQRVAAVVKGSVETPNDISGVVYVAMDIEGEWKNAIRLELRSAKYPV
ncbi:TIR domain-containing protein [Rhizobium brockwellii]|uniref:TIR domain-containing protein n=1 Tax=Rhizobium brockwellii TaxID=3019932 RepID=UPI003F9A55B3